MNENKLNGSYYTPELLTDFIVNYIFLSKEWSQLSILEPSAGDGIFLKSLLRHAKSISNIDIVEKNNYELEKSKIFSKDYSKHGVITSFFNNDFLKFFMDNKRKYDLVIGNPPYIHLKHITTEQLRLLNKSFKNLNFAYNNVKNIWIAFVVLSTELLNNDGTLCFVLPSELLQVNYSEHLREYLYEQFNKIELITFNKKFFRGTNQDVVIFIGAKNGNKRQINNFLINDLSVLKEHMISPLMPINCNNSINSTKWNSFNLSTSELNFLDRIKRTIKTKVRDYVDSSVGIVTGADNFFIIKESVANENKIKNYCMPIIKGNISLPNCFRFTDNDLSSFIKKGFPCYLLCIDCANKSKNLSKYIKAGEEVKIHLKFKCSKRNPWYKVPSIWASEGIFFRRTNKFPRIFVNKAAVLVTDTGFRYNMKNNYNIEVFTFSFYNTITLIFTELEGRRYGGGVLELTPNEFKDLPIIYQEVPYDCFEYLDNMLREGHDINKILDYTDNHILCTKGFSPEEIVLLRKIYSKLVEERLKKKKYYLD